jgi:hypothetical protein
MYKLTSFDDEDTILAKTLSLSLENFKEIKEVANDDEFNKVSKISLEEFKKNELNYFENYSILVFPFSDKLNQHLLIPVIDNDEDKKISFYLESVDGDGHCLFSAIGSHINVSYSDLREITASLLLTYDTNIKLNIYKNYHYVYNRYYGNNIRSNIKNIFSYIRDDYKSSKNDKYLLQSYAEDIGKNYYGGDLEIYLIAKFYDLNIFVFSHEGNVLNLIYYVRNDNAPTSQHIYLLYQNRNHYDILKFVV